MFNKFLKKIRHSIDKILQGTHDHYTWFLPERIGVISSFLLEIFFSGIRLDDDQKSVILRLPKDSVIIYVTKHTSNFERLFYYSRYRIDGLPFPEIGFFNKIFLWQPVSRLFKICLAHLDHFFRHLAVPDPFKSGYIKNELLDRRTAIVSLVKPNEFYRRFVKSKTDPLQYLIKMQRSVDRPIYLVPQLMFFGKTPSASGQGLRDTLTDFEQKPGAVRRLWALISRPGKIFVEVSEPILLKDFIEAPDNSHQNDGNLALKLRHQLLDQINRHRRSITGPILKSIEEIKQHILTNNRLQSFIKTHAERRSISVQKVHGDALKYVDEIAAAPRPFFIKMGIHAAKWILDHMFEEISYNKNGLSKMKQASRKGPLILIPCHKSHIDYLVISYVMNLNNIPCPHIFAGKNLSFWPMGPLFRKVGAFFVRRSFKGAVFYSKVFSEYIHMLLEQGFNIEVFIEGTRSRNGKLLLPKLGMLSILLNAVKNGACEHITFVPIFIGYDRVPEERSYLLEIEGRGKKPESFWQLIKAGQFLKRKFGKIYIRFGDPILSGDLADELDSPIQSMSSKELNTFCRDLGNRVLSTIDRNAVVTPQALVSAAILNSSREIINSDHLMLTIETFMTHLSFQQAGLSETLLSEKGHAVSHILDYYTQSKMIHRFSQNGSGPETSVRYRMNEYKRPAMEYYKNTCIGYFVPAAFTALSIIERNSFLFTASDLYPGYKFLREFFKNEFTHHPDKTDEYLIRKAIKAFIDDGIVIPHPALPETYNLTSQGYRKLQSFAGFLEPFFESYWVVLKHFKSSPNPSGGMDRLKKIRVMGNRMYKRREIDRKEALSEIYYANAVEFFIRNGVRGSEDTAKINFYAEKIRNCMEHLSR